MRARGFPAAGQILTSLDNPTIKWIRSLRQRKTRETERVFVVEGVRAIADGLRAGFDPALLLVRLADRDNAARWFAGRTTLVCDDRLFESLTDTVTPQGALAVFPFPERPIRECDDPLYLILDELRDPGNLGTLLRAAAGAGVSTVLTTTGTVDPFNPKAVRAGAGAHFRVPIRELDDATTARLRAGVPTRVIADAAGEALHDAVDWRGPAALILGSEAHGVSGSTRSLATVAARVPLAAGVESLNVALAGAVILFEAARQRRANHGQNAGDGGFAAGIARG